MQARKKGAAAEGRSTGGPGESLFGGERRIGGLGGRVAALELGGCERAAVDKEAVDSAGALGERLAQHDRAAFVGRALAGGGAAVPDDVAGNEALAGRAGSFAE